MLSDSTSSRPYAFTSRKPVAVVAYRVAGVGAAFRFADVPLGGLVARLSLVLASDGHQ